MVVESVLPQAVPSTSVLHRNWSATVTLSDLMLSFFRDLTLETKKEKKKGEFEIKQASCSPSIASIFSRMLCSALHGFFNCLDDWYCKV